MQRRLNSDQLNEVKLKKSSVKWLIVGIIISGLMLGTLAIGFWITNHPSNSQQDDIQNQLTIASFESEVKPDEPEIQTYLDFKIHNCWIEGNNIRCSGTVIWQTTEYTLEGMQVCMFITQNQTNSVNVEVVIVDMYGGYLPPTETIDFDNVPIPKLVDQSHGDPVTSFDFSLTCIYQA